MGSPAKEGMAEVAITDDVGSLDVFHVNSCRSLGGQGGVDMGGEGYPKTSWYL